MVKLRRDDRKICPLCLAVNGSPTPQLWRVPSHYSSNWSIQFVVWEHKNIRLDISLILKENILIYIICKNYSHVELELQRAAEKEYFSHMTLFIYHCIYKDNYHR